MKKRNDIKQLDIETAILETLSNYRKIIKSQFMENEEEYNQRFHNFPGDYGTSRSDDYNGDGEEYSRLSNLLIKINQ
ncbi:MAG: hypothetical protein ABFD75_09500 [Smithella sp.]